MGNPDDRIPVVIITGFLGSGKTTLLNHMLSSNTFGRVAALVNDFGAINIDADLIEPVADEVVQLTNGCVCCTINDDLLGAAERILKLEPPVDRIVVETTGLADPLPVGLTFLQTDLRERTSVDAIVTVVDCSNFVLDLFRSDAAMAQIIHGDLIVLNKNDLVDDQSISSLKRRIRVIQPRARLLTSSYGKIPLEPILAGSALALPATTDTTTPIGHRHELLNDGFAAYAFQLDEPLSATRFQAWLDEGLPAGVFRAKGILHFDRSERAFLFQLCGHRSTFDPHPGPAAGSRIVFIGREVEAKELGDRLRSCLLSVAA